MSEGIITRRGTPPPPPPPPPWGDDIPYYWEGDEFEATTGGWLGETQDGQGSVQKQSDNLKIQTQDGGSTVCFYTQNKIDLEGVDLIRVELDSENLDASPSDGSRRSSFRLQIYFEYSSDFNSNFDARTIDYDNGMRVVELDVSGFNGEYHIVLLQRTGASVSVETTSDIFKVWGEA